MLYDKKIESSMNTEFIFQTRHWTKMSFIRFHIFVFDMTVNIWNEARQWVQHISIHCNVKYISLFLKFLTVNLHGLTPVLSASNDLFVKKSWKICPWMSVIQGLVYKMKLLTVRLLEKPNGNNIDKKIFIFILWFYISGFVVSNWNFLSGVSDMIFSL